MEAVYENWFDYEIGGKVPLSLLESQFNEEMSNFEKMLNAIDVCNESGVATVSINENAITDKIRELWDKFTAWFKGIIEKIKGTINDIKSGIEFVKRIKANMKNINWDKLESDFDARYRKFVDSNQEIIDAEYVIVEGNNVFKGQYLGCELSGGVLLSDVNGVNKVLDKAIYDDNVSKINNWIERIIHNENNESEIDSIVSDMNSYYQKVKENYKSVKCTIIFESKFDGNPKGYVEYLTKHVEDSVNAIPQYEKIIQQIEQNKEQFSKQVTSIAKTQSPKAANALMKCLSKAIQEMNGNINKYNRILTTLKKDKSFSEKTAWYVANISNRSDLKN